MAAAAEPQGFRIEVSADGMLAELVLGAPQQGPARLDPAAVRQALLAAGVVSGITPPGVLEATGTGSELRAVVACGNAPVPGEDSRFELLVSETRDRSPVVDADGLVDFRELGAIPLVVAGQALMRRHPPVPGVDGLTVRGEVVAAAAGQELPFDLPLPGVRISAASPDVLEAEVNGQPVREGNGVRIEQVLRVSRVDVASGNLEFDGTVQVDGDVQSGMRLSATGDIVILGGVEGGEVSAGGDVRVAGGVIAHGIIRAGGAVSARFVEAAKVRAGTSIMIEDNALQSELEAMNAIRVGARSARRGRLAGGVARAMLLIQAPWVGAEAGALTRIELGVNPDLDERYAEVLRRIEEHKAGEAKLQSLIKHLSRQKDNPALLQRAQVSWQHSVRTWAKLLPQRDALELERARAASARIEIDAGLDGAVDLVIATRSARLRQALGAGTLALDGERIVFHARAHALPTKDA